MSLSTPIHIDEMPVMGARARQPEQSSSTASWPRAPKQPRRGYAAPARKPSPPLATEKCSAGAGVRAFLLGLAASVALILLLAALAPRDYRQPVDPASVSGAAAACGSYGAPTSAVETNSTGYRLITLTCADGVRVMVAR